jgi:hypothetical protein
MELISQRCNCMTRLCSECRVYEDSVLCSWPGRCLTMTLLSAGNSRDGIRQIRPNAKYIILYLIISCQCASMAHILFTNLIPYIIFLVLLLWEGASHCAAVRAGVCHDGVRSIGPTAVILQCCASHEVGILEALVFV